MKAEIGEEDLNYHQVLERCKNNTRHGKTDPYDIMKICPITFSTEHKTMLVDCKALLSDGFVAINPTKFPNLTTALSTATDRDNALQKDSMNYSDVFDAFRLAINPHMYEVGG